MGGPNEEKDSWCFGFRFVSLSRRFFAFLSISQLLSCSAKIIHIPSSFRHFLKNFYNCLRKHEKMSASGLGLFFMILHLVVLIVAPLVFGNKRHLG